jgi:hypothetical protein
MDNTRYIDLCAAGLYRQMQHAAAKVLEETKGRYSSQSWLGPKATGTALQAVQWLPTQGRYPPTHSRLSAVMFVDSPCPDDARNQHPHQRDKEGPDDLHQVLHAEDGQL